MFYKLINPNRLPPAPPPPPPIFELKVLKVTFLNPLFKPLYIIIKSTLVFILSPTIKSLFITISLSALNP